MCMPGGESYSKSGCVDALLCAGWTGQPGTALWASVISWVVAVSALCQLQVLQQQGRTVSISQQLLPSPRANPQTQVTSPWGRAAFKMIPQVQNILTEALP